MAKKRKVVRDDDELVEDSSPQQTCTTIDHVYPSNPGSDTKCFCGKRTWRPYIQPEEILKVGNLIRTTPGGPIWRVEMVNHGRAHCRCVTADEALRRLNHTYQEDPEDEASGRTIDISPRSACERVLESELTQASEVRSSNMAKQFGSIPVAGKSVKERESDRKAKLATKPKGEARPLTGAAAKAKASARPKVVKTVRKCACGCGDETMSYFVPGHDARYKGWLKKIAAGTMEVKDLKKAVQDAAGPWKKKGAGYVPSISYKGEKYVAA